MDANNLTDERPTHLDLFSGIGGFALAAQWAGFRTIGFCEIDGYCQKVLAKNFGAVADAASDGQHWGKVEGSVTETIPNTTQRQTADSNTQGRRSSWPECPRCYGNIFDLDGTQFRGVSLITGGFPCQPFSVAGKRGGAADDRAIWPEMFRVIKEARPAFVLGENVPGIIPMELDNVLSDLEGICYAARAFVIPACAVDARHRRDRLWIIGRRIVGDPANIRSEVGHAQHTESNRQEKATDVVPRSQAIPDANEQRSQGRNGQELPERSRERSTGARDSQVADPDERGFTRRCESDRWGCESGRVERCCRWQPEPDVGRVAHGVSKRVDRLKGLGNAIVPQVAYEILREIRKLI